MKTTTLYIILLCAGLFCSLNSNASTYYWVASSNSNWSILTNWKLSSCSGSAPTHLPGSSDSVVFSGSCSSYNCNIDTIISVLSIRTDNSFSGTITQNSGKAITAAYGKFALGTFDGGSSAITFSKAFTLEGGAFTTTSGTTTIEGNFSYTGGTFYPNNGRVVFYKTLTVSGVTTSSSINLYDVEFQAVAGNSTITLYDIIFNVSDSTLLTGSNQLFINASQSTSVINAGGDVKDYNSATTGGGTATIIINGSSTQYLTSTSSTEDLGKLPNLTINSSGTVYLIGYITMGGSTTLTYTAGTINAGSSTVVFYYNNAITGAMTFNNIEFQGTVSVCTVNNTITVNGNMVNSGSSRLVINTGTINIYGNLTVSNTCNYGGLGSSYNGGTTVLNMAGSTDQYITASSGVAQGDGMLGFVHINKTGGTLYLSGNISIMNEWINNYSTANINPGTSSLFLQDPNGTVNIGGTYPTPLYNVTFGDISNCDYNIESDSAFSIHNKFILAGNHYFQINGHSINIEGNISITNTIFYNNSNSGGSTILNLVGSANDSINAASGLVAGDGILGVVHINKTGGTLYLSGTISIMNEWINNYSTTNINPGTSNLFLLKPNGTVNIGGSYRTPLWNATFGGTSATYYNIEADSSFIIHNNLYLAGTHDFQVNGYSLDIQGSIDITNTGNYNSIYSGGSTIFNLVGSANDSINSASGVTLDEGILPNLQINKTGGTLYLTGLISEGTNWTYINGTVNAGTSTVGMYASGYTLTGTGSSSSMTFNNVVIGANTYLGNILNVGGTLTINSSKIL